MANSTTHLDLLTQGQSAKEVTANAVFNAASPATLYAMRLSATSGLTWGYYGGNVTLASGSMSQIANGTLALTASATNYIVAAKSDGAVSVSTAATNWNDSANYWRLYSVVAGAATYSSYTDYRQIGQLTGAPSFGAMLYQGSWNASTNSPALAGGVGTQGHYYVVNTAGTTSIDGIALWSAGDIIVFNGAAWEKIDASLSAQEMGNLINSATEKTTPAAADMLGLMDSATGNILKKLSIANFKSAIKTYLEGTALIIGGTTPAAGTFTTLTATGSATLGDAEASDTHAIKGATTLLVNSASDALRITQTGSGNALVVEDEANPDSTPFVVDASGKVTIGKTSAYDATALLQLYSTSAYQPQAAFTHSGNTAVSAAYIKFQRERASGTAVVAGDVLGQCAWQGHDGTQQSSAATITCYAEGTISSGVVPGHIRFSTANSAGTLTERMRIDSSGNVTIGGTPVTGRRFVVGGNLTGATSGYITLNGATVQPDVTVGVYGIATNISTGANGGTPWTISALYHYNASQATFHADSTVTNQIGYSAPNTLIGAANNYGFFGNIPLGTGRWNFYAAGTARNFMAGRLDVGGAARTDTAAAPSLTNPTNFYSASATYTNGVTAASGTVAHVAVNSFDNPALAASNTGVTYTSASTVYIDGPPTAGTNVTIANPYALYVASGDIYFGDKVGIGEAAPDYKLDVNGTFGFAPGASVTPVDNGDVVFEFSDDTTLTIRGKGSDGTVRAGAITLS